MPDVEKLQPVMDEFVAAVEEGNAGFIKACLSHPDRARALAVMCAGYLLEAETQIEHLPETHRRFEQIAAENTRLRKDLADARQRIKDLRGFLYEAASRRKKAA